MTLSEKNPFQQKPNEFELGEMNPDGDSNSDDSDDFNEFYMQNNPKFMLGGDRKKMAGLDSSHTNTLEATAQKFGANYASPGDDAGRG